MGDLDRGETQMKRVRTLLTRAIVAALLLVALSANVASANPGSAGTEPGPSSGTTSIPEDPGLD